MLVTMSRTTNNSTANKGIGDKKRKRNGDNNVFVSRSLAPEPELIREFCRASEVDGREKSGEGEDDVRYVRITSGGKIKLWVNFALEFFRVSGFICLVGLLFYFS